MKKNMLRLGLCFGLVLVVGLWNTKALAAPVHSDRQMTEASQVPKPVEGELVNVDTKARTLEVRTTSGEDMWFRYDDKTEVTGAMKGVAGLATEKGAEITVQYRVDDDPPENAPKFIATKIDVRESGR